MHVLSIENITKSFDGLQVLHGISLHVDKGEAVAVIGPSGSGKSTLLRCATLLERIDTGSISYGGEPVAWDAPAGENGKAAKSVYAGKNELHAIRRRFGLVFQSFHLFPHLSVLRNLTEAPVRVLKIPKERAKEDAMRLLEKVGLSDKAAAYPFQLSGGQQQRVAIARAMALSPEILFFDEPTSALDPELTGEILKVIRTLAAEHMTMVIVTHEMAFAAEVADRVIFMDEGRIIEQGTPKEVLEHSENARTKAFLRKLSDN
ncbi:MAG TPA: glutamine ABC transporter ATP-binding protein [Ruminococcaceae bacterium]|nr:glutamine ABC transporter ATP-binding protein [Oscillospiraceae bacterium]